MRVVRGGDDGGFLEETFELGFAEVGDADCSCFAAFEGLLHRFPCFNVIGAASLDLVILLGHKGVASGEGTGPMHQVEV